MGANFRGTSDKDRVQHVVDCVRGSQRVLAEAEKQIEEGLKDLDVLIKQLITGPLTKKFPGLCPLDDMHGGCHTADWKPSVAVMGKNHEQLARRGDKILGWYDGRKKVDNGIDPQALVDECERLTKAYGIEVEIYWLRDDPELAPLSRVEDIKDLYGDDAVLDNGDIATKGWEGIDSWCIACIGGRIRLFVWGLFTGGPEFTSEEEFFGHVEQDDDNDHVRDKWQYRITDNWRK